MQDNQENPSVLASLLASTLTATCLMAAQQMSGVKVNLRSALVWCFLSLCTEEIPSTPQLDLEDHKMYCWDSLSPDTRKMVWDTDYFKLDTKTLVVRCAPVVVQKVWSSQTACVKYWDYWGSVVWICLVQHFLCSSGKASWPVYLFFLWSSASWYCLIILASGTVRSFRSK